MAVTVSGYLACTRPRGLTPKSRAQMPTTAELIEVSEDPPAWWCCAIASEDRGGRSMPTWLWIRSCALDNPRLDAGRSAARCVSSGARPPRSMWKVDSRTKDAARLDCRKAPWHFKALRAAELSTNKPTPQPNPG